MLLRHFNSLVKRLLLERGITRRQAAQALDMSEASLSHRLNNRTPWDGNELETLAGLLGDRLSTLFALAEADVGEHLASAS